MGWKEAKEILSKEKNLKYDSKRSEMNLEFFFDGIFSMNSEEIKILVYGISPRSMSPKINQLISKKTNINWTVNYQEIDELVLNDMYHGIIIAGIFPFLSESQVKSNIITLSNALLNNGLILGINFLFSQSWIQNITPQIPFTVSNKENLKTLQGTISEIFVLLNSNRESSSTLDDIRRDYFIIQKKID